MSHGGFERSSCCTFQFPSTELFPQHNFPKWDCRFRWAYSFWIGEVWWMLFISFSSLPSPRPVSIWNYSNKVFSEKLGSSCLIYVRPSQESTVLLPISRLPNSNRSNQHLERLYNCVVGCLFGHWSRWQQFLCYSGLWRCWLMMNDCCLRDV